MFKKAKSSDRSSTVATLSTANAEWPFKTQLENMSAQCQHIMRLSTKLFAYLFSRLANVVSVRD